MRIKKDLADKIVRMISRQKKSEFFILKFDAAKDLGKHSRLQILPKIPGSTKQMK